MRRLLAISLLLIPCVFSHAQSIPVNTKPGIVSLEEVAMETYQLDTSARALVLCESTQVDIVTTEYLEMSQIFTFNTRIKVLKESGKDEADFRITYPEKDYLHGLSVVTYNLEDGKVRRTKLEKKYIFTEKINERLMTCSFSAPEVRVGSVVEVAYTLSTSNNYMDVPSLPLQKDIPINTVTVSFSCPDFFRVNKSNVGWLSPIYSKSVYSKPLKINGLSSCAFTSESYTLHDVPALSGENMAMCPEQYLCQVNYEVSGVEIPGFVYKDYSTKWTDVDKLVRDTRIVTQCQVKGKSIEPFKSQETDAKKAVEEVRKAVLAAVKWNQKRALMPRDVKEVLKEGTGSSASINAIVASVLNSMGYKASPVLLRGRSHGRLSNFYVRTDAFTDMILKVETPSGEAHFLDAAPDYGYIDVLNPDFFVTDARVIPCSASEAAGWEDLTKISRGISSFMVSAKLVPGGTVEGTLGMTSQGTASYLIKQTRESLGSDDKYFQLVERGEDFESISYTYEGEPFTQDVRFSIEYQQNPVQSGEFLYIKPFLVTEHKESDFPAGERLMPVDFDFKEALSYTYTLEIPEGYEVVEVPPSRSFRAGSFGARAACKTTVSDGIVKIMVSFNNTSLMVEQAKYDELRSFWEQLCNIYKGTIVLRKI
ncbi:MAG: DUF3857 domain-containing protein [Bacteroidales bacterium]|nr:DUF3857 domain-containing protein [Bacteroidales bacterium]